MEYCRCVAVMVLYRVVGGREKHGGVRGSGQAGGICRCGGGTSSYWKPLVVTLGKGL